MPQHKNQKLWRGALVAGMGAGERFWPGLLPAGELAPQGPWQVLAAGEQHWRFVDEVAQLRAGLAALPHDGAPLVLGGHSYGAQHVIALVQTYREQNMPLVGIVLLAPALGKWWLAEAGWRMSAWVFFQGRRPPELFLSDQEIEQLNQGELRHHATMLRQNQLPQFWGAAAQAGMGFDWGDVARLDVPVLVVGSEGDRVVPLVVPVGGVPANVTVVKLGREHGHFLFLRAARIWAEIATWVDSLKA